VKAKRAWSSMATNSISQPAPSTESRRLPLTRWLGRSMRGRDGAESLFGDLANHLVSTRSSVWHACGCSFGLCR
jgi:hypothetical protein